MSVTNKQKRNEKNKGKAPINQLRKRIDGINASLTKKFNSLVENVQRALSSVNQQVVSNAQRQEVIEQVIEQLDVNNLVLAHVTKEIYGKLEQMEAYLQGVAQQTEWTPEELNLEELRKESRKKHEATVSNCYRIVMEEREAEIKRRREEAKKQSEQQAAEKTLKDAEENKVSDTPGGEGTDIPAGAEVFGG